MRPFRTKGIVDVAEGDDAGRQRNGRARQSIRIAGPVEGLVVMPGDVGGHLQQRQGRTVLAMRNPLKNVARRALCASA